MVTHVAPVRLVLARNPSLRDHLHGAWWPRSLRIVEEIPLLLTALASRDHTVRGVTLNRDEWPDAPLVIPLGVTAKLRIGWYGLPDAHIALLHLDQQRKRSLLVIPPATPEATAVTAMLMAVRPGNSQDPSDVLAHAAHAQQAQA